MLSPKNIKRAKGTFICNDNTGVITQTSYLCLTAYFAKFFLLFCFPTLFFILLLSSCGSSKIETNYLDKEQTINLGDTATLRWDFLNANFVLFGGNNYFRAIDTVAVSPKLTTIYNVTAFNNEDTVNLQSTVFVKTPPENLTGGEETLNLESYKTSAYWNGIKDSETIDKVSRLQVVKSKVSPFTEKYVVDFLIFDNYGNFLDNTNITNLKNAISVNMYCDNGTQEIKLQDLEFIRPVTYKEIANKKVALHFVIENSFANIYNENIINGIKRFLNQLPDKLTKNLTISLYLQNQDLSAAFENLSKPQAINELENYSQITPNGSNAQYHNLYKLINGINKNAQKDDTNIIFNLTYTQDLSSFLFNIQDIKQELELNDISIYNIQVTNFSEMYSTKFFSRELGTSPYYIGAENLNSTSNIIQELFYSQFYHYRAVLETPQDSEICAFSKIEMKINNQNFPCDNIDSDIKSASSLNRYKTLALFNYKSNTLNQEYKPILDLLVKTLLKNEKQHIELVGNAGVEGSNDNCYELSDLRTAAVKNYLTQNGVNNNQISVRFDGSSRPIYFIINNRWQEVFNRRVEMRWLNAENLPYEITTDIVESEEQALQKVQNWQKLNYKSYFERLIVDNAPVYKVKLWGYGTKSEAEEVVKKLRHSYANAFIIE